MTARPRSVLDGLPDGALVPVGWVRDLLEEVQPEPVIELESGRTPEFTWCEKLWIVPPETRLTATDVAQALARPKSFVYDRTQSAAAHPIPHRKLDGALVFLAGEIRAWIRSREEVMVAGPIESTPSERAGLSVL